MARSKYVTNFRPSICSHRRARTVSSATWTIQIRCGAPCAAWTRFYIWRRPRTKAPFAEELLPNNIAGVYNLLEAAHAEKVRRVVFVSSVQTVWDAFQRTDLPIETNVNVPCSLYGVSKIFGETLGGWFHRHRGLEFVAIRLGWFERTELLEPNAWINNVWISPGDSARLFCCALETCDVGFTIVNGTSKTPREILSLRSAREILGYEPRDVAPTITKEVA